MPAPFKTRAVVLSSRAIGESDLLISLCAPAGKIKAVAKGAKRSKKRFLNSLEPFTLLSAVLVPSRASSLFRIDSAEVQKNFPRLRTDIQSYTLASLCCELAEMWTVEGDPQTGIFSLLTWYLNALEENISPQKTTLFFKVRLLSLAGYSPDWKKCPGCKGRAHGPAADPSPCAAASLCTRMDLAPGIFCALEYISRSRLENLHRLVLSPEAFDKAWTLIRELHCIHLHKCPASYKVLPKILR